MKNIFLLLIFAFGFTSAQNLIEDSEISENVKEFGRISVSFDLNNAAEFYRLKCENPIYAQFSGGENVFKESLFKNMKSYLDSGVYSVNGIFELIMFVDKEGKLQNFILKPEVPNSNLLYRDLELVMKKIYPTWIPASCSGVPVDSKIRQKINFRTDNFDI
ncbi:hypothetical protein [Chryseobacterium sp.]|uniref:hypothetical protein n=1 Tax=Chryseobacterium sp. TaxID=1871047 RepID=UPI0011CAA35D|nr:hypothetical protein [Chryseobacterium sp.]TXF75900.1 hypothetical protein FUA25_08315 [Chryseobacterium sp.]